MIFTDSGTIWGLPQDLEFSEVACLQQTAFLALLQICDLISVKISVLLVLLYSANCRLKFSQTDLWTHSKFSWHFRKVSSKFLFFPSDTIHCINFNRGFTENRYRWYSNPVIQSPGWSWCLDYRYFTLWMVTGQSIYYTRLVVWIMDGRTDEWTKTPWAKKLNLKANVNVKCRRFRS